MAEQEFSLFFVYYFLDYVKYAFADFHFDMFQDIDDLLADKIREVVWLMFRESAKTSIAKAFLMWTFAFKKRMYLNVDSFDRENAERMLFDTVVELQTNKKLIADFNQLYNAKRNPEEISQKRVNNFIGNNGVRVEAHSTQESVRGRLHGHQRPDWLLIDDFETNKTKDSKAYTLQVINHINEFKAGLAPDAKVMYLGNYITEYGSIQTLIERAKEDKGLRIRNVPVVLGSINWNDLTILGKIAWDNKYCLTDKEAGETGKVSLEDKRRQLGTQVFNAEMMNQPIDEMTQEFYRTWFKYRTQAEVDAMITRKFATIDTALSEADGDDFTAICKNYVNEKKEWNLDTQRYRINSKALIEMIFKLHDQGFEKIGIEETVYLGAIKPFFDDECKKRGKYPYVVALKHRGRQKETRIRGVIPRYEQGMVFHIDKTCYDLEEEALRFPKSPFDDCLDAVQYQNDIAEAPFPKDDEPEPEPAPSPYSDIGM